MTRYTALLQTLAHNIPAHFLERVIQVLPQVYAEAYARTYKDPLFGPDSPEAHDLIGQERHYIFQAKLHEIASECKLSSVATLNPRGTGSYRVIRAGQFVLTASSVRSPNDRPRFALFRKKLAAVNNLLVQRVLEFMPLAEIQSADVGTFTGIIIHGPQLHNPAEVGFVNLGIPSPRQKRWVFCEPLVYILRARNVDASPVTTETLLDKVQPRRLRIRKSEGGKA